MRIVSLRLDKKAEQELEYIKSIHENQSQAVKEAIHAYYEILMKTEKPKISSEMFKSSGYVGSFKAKKDLSTNYKEELTSDLKKKHGIK